MANQKTIVVFGATGAQGGGIARAILADPNTNYKVRAVTRDANSGKAKELAALGAEVISCDIDNDADVQKAFDGAQAAYCVTFYWAHFSPEREMAEIASMANAAMEADTQHVIWSTLEDTRKWVPLEDDRMPTLHGKYKVPHFDGKGASDHLFTDAGVPTTFLLTSFYWDNFIYFGSGPQKLPDGRLAITFPMADKKLPGIAAEDIGKCAYGILKRGADFIGKRVGIAGEHLTGAQLAEAFTKALGREVIYNDVPADVYRSFPFPGADDLGNMFQFKRDFESYFCGIRDVGFSRELNPELQNFDTWLERNKMSIPLP